jgi:alpha-glucosidase
MTVVLTWLLVAAAAVSATSIDLRSASNGDPLAQCPGYKASNIKTGKSTLTADLKLAGKACNAYGTDLTSLTLEVEYESGKLQQHSCTHQLAPNE